MVREPIRAFTVAVVTLAALTGGSCGSSDDEARTAAEDFLQAFAENEGSEVCDRIRLSAIAGAEYKGRQLPRVALDNCDAGFGPFSTFGFFQHIRGASSAKIVSARRADDAVTFKLSGGGAMTVEKDGDAWVLTCVHVRSATEARVAWTCPL